MNRIKTHAFTLIELLMVIAIIGILAGILIPTVGAVRKQANVAASKSQLSNYVTAIQLFKGEYSYYPNFGVSATGDSYSVPLKSKSVEFIETLSGRDTDGKPLNNVDAKTRGNRKKIAFHSFAESEFLFGDDDEYSTTELADRFDNKNMVIVIDADGDGFVAPSPGSSQLSNSLPSGGKVRSPITAFTDENDVTGEEGDPTYSLW